MEDFIFCCPLRTTLKAVDVQVVTVVSDCFKENNLSWTKLVAVLYIWSTAMVLNLSGFVAPVK